MKTKKIHLIFILTLLFCSCFGGKKIWGMDREILLKLMQSGQWEMLVNLDYTAFEESGRLKEIHRLGPGASYYFSRIFSQPDQWRKRRLFLELAVQQEDEPWSAAALDPLLSLYSQRGEYEATVSLYEKYPDLFSVRTERVEYYLEALFHIERYEDVLNIAESFPDSTIAIRAYSVLSHAALENKGWEKDLESFIFQEKAGKYHRVIEDYILDRGLEAYLSRDAALYLSGKIDLAAREYGQAYNSLSFVLERPELFDSYPGMYKDWRLIFYVNQNLRGNWAERFLEWANHPESRDGGHTAAYIAGRLFRYEESYEQSAAAFLEALDRMNPSPSLYHDEVLWYYLKSLQESDPGQFLYVFSQSVDLWDDPEYFHDLVEEAAVLSIRDPENSYIDELLSKLKSNGSMDSRILVSWIKALTLLDQNKSAQFELNFIQENDRWGYYGMMSSYLLGRRVEFLDSIPEGEEKSSPDFLSGKLGSTDSLVMGHIYYGQLDQAYRAVLDLGADVSPGIIATVSRELFKEGKYLEAIRSFSIIDYHLDYGLTKKEIERLYPFLYEQAVDQAAREFTIDRGLVLSVIRTESAFMADIGSHAGAQGLMQLMPSTAEERARQLGMESFDLHNPSDNVRLGTSHLRWLRERDWAKNYTDVLMAYNAGGGNLRKWHRRFPEMDTLHFIEAIPYKETRHYVKKNLFALVVYDYIYNGINPALTIDDFLKEE